MEPDKFLLPRPSDQRFNWVVVRLAALDTTEMRELVVDAWRLVVPSVSPRPTWVTDVAPGSRGGAFRQGSGTRCSATFDGEAAATGAVYGPVDLGGAAVGDLGAEAEIIDTRLGG